MAVPVPIPRPASRASRMDLLTMNSPYSGAGDFDWDTAPLSPSSSSPRLGSLRTSSALGSRPAGLRRVQSVVGIDAAGHERVVVLSLPSFFDIAGDLLPHGGVGSSALNLASATLGAGVLALPAAMAASGVVLGSLSLLLCYVATVFSIRLLTLVTERTQQRTYEEISEFLFGRVGKIFTATLIMLFCFGVTIMYIVMLADVFEIIADTIEPWPDMLRGRWGRRMMIFGYWSVLMLPLSMLREINSLRYASLVGMLSSLFLVMAMALDSLRYGRLENLTLWNWNAGALAAVSIFTFSFCCQTNVFEIYAELQHRTVHKMTFTTALSMYACTALYLVASIAGAAEFGATADPNILKSYTNIENKWYLVVSLLGVVITLTMAFPICVFPMRDALLALLGYDDIYETPTFHRCAVAGSLATVSLLGGVFISSLQILIGILGGITGGMVSYILPVVFAWKSGVLWSLGVWHEVAALLMLLFGAAIGIMNAVFAVCDMHLVECPDALM